MGAPSGGGSRFGAWNFSGAWNLRFGTSPSYFGDKPLLSPNSAYSALFAHITLA